jgi:hypothetical protein
MKIYLVISIVIALTIYTSIETSYGLQQKGAGLLLYNNTNYGFQLLYPQDWNVIEGDSKP